MKFNSKFSDFFISKVLQITAVSTVVFYIIFSATKRFTENDKYLWISFILFVINLFLLLELIYMAKTKKINYTKKEFKNLIFQAILNVCFVILVSLYLF